MATDGTDGPDVAAWHSHVRDTLSREWAEEFVHHTDYSTPKYLHLYLLRLCLEASPDAESELARAVALAAAAGFPTVGAAPSEDDREDALAAIEDDWGSCYENDMCGSERAAVDRHFRAIESRYLSLVTRLK